MTDREKVIKGIDICLQRFRCGEDCPYYNTEKIGCMEQLREDALALLNEQEKDRLEIAHEMVSNSILMYQNKEIVRCKDCKYKDDEYFFTMRRYGQRDDWFCADGEYPEIVHRCENCNEILYRYYKYCPTCGKSVK